MLEISTFCYSCIEYPIWTIFYDMKACSLLFMIHYLIESNVHLDVSNPQRCHHGYGKTSTTKQ